MAPCTRAADCLKIPGLQAALGKTVGELSFPEKTPSERFLSAYFQLQRIRLRCRDTVFFANVASELQWEFLKRNWGRTPTQDVDLFFRILLTEPGAGGSTKSMILDQAKREHLGTQALARRLYGNLKMVRGVPVFGAVEAASYLEKNVQAVCGDQKECRFWDPFVIQRVLLVPTKGLAAFSQATQTLTLSTSLLDPPTTLGLWVVLHELTHVAVKIERARTDRDWPTEFAKFSGWGDTSLQLAPLGDRSDALAAQAKQLGVSWMPDTVLVPRTPAGESLDGFVAAKSFRESIQQGSPEEDLADHVAAFLVAKDRFCFQGRPIAPRKWEWIGREVFHTSPVLKCATERRRGR